MSILSSTRSGIRGIKIDREKLIEKDFVQCKYNGYIMYYMGSMIHCIFYNPDKCHWYVAFGKAHIYDTVTVVIDTIIKLDTLIAVFNARDEKTRIRLKKKLISMN